MYLQHAKLSNFRGISHIDIRLEKDITVLTGEHPRSKAALLEALELVLGMGHKQLCTLQPSDLRHNHGNEAYARLQRRPEHAWAPAHSHESYSPAGDQLYAKPHIVESDDLELIRSLGLEKVIPLRTEPTADGERRFYTVPGHSGHGRRLIVAELSHEQIRSLSSSACTEAQASSVSTCNKTPTESSQHDDGRTRAIKVAPDALCGADTKDSIVIELTFCESNEHELINSLGSNTLTNWAYHAPDGLYRILYRVRGQFSIHCGALPHGQPGQPSFENPACNPGHEPSSCCFITVHELLDSYGRSCPCSASDILTLIARIPVMILRDRRLCPDTQGSSCTQASSDTQPCSDCSPAHNEQPPVLSSAHTAYGSSAQINAAKSYPSSSDGMIFHFLGALDTSAPVGCPASMATAGNELVAAWYRGQNCSEPDTWKRSSCTDSFQDTNQLAASLAHELYMSMGAHELDCRSSPIMIVEGIESIFHPVHFSGLMRIVKGLPLQKLIVTNSSQLMSQVPVSSLRRLCMSEGVVQCFDTSGLTLTDNEARRIAFHTGVLRSGSLFARCWLLVEGESEVWLLNHMADLLGVNLQENGIRIIEFVQCGLSPLIHFARHMGISFHVLTDGDHAGQYFQGIVHDLTEDMNTGSCLTAIPLCDLEHWLYQCGFADVYQKQSELHDSYDCLNLTVTVLEKLINSAPELKKLFRHSLPDFIVPCASTAPVSMPVPQSVHALSTATAPNSTDASSDRRPGTSQGTAHPDLTQASSADTGSKSSSPAAADSAGSLPADCDHTSSVYPGSGAPDSAGSTADPYQPEQASSSTDEAATAGRPEKMKNHNPQVVIRTLIENNFNNCAEFFTEMFKDLPQYKFIETCRPCRLDELTSHDVMETSRYTANIMRKWSEGLSGFNAAAMLNHFKSVRAELNKIAIPAKQMTADHDASLKAYMVAKTLSTINLHNIAPFLKSVMKDQEHKEKLKAAAALKLDNITMVDLQSCKELICRIIDSTNAAAANKSKSKKKAIAERLFNEITAKYKDRFSTKGSADQLPEKATAKNQSHYAVIKTLMSADYMGSRPLLEKLFESTSHWKAINQGKVFPLTNITTTSIEVALNFIENTVTKAAEDKENLKNRMLTLSASYFDALGKHLADLHSCAVTACTAETVNTGTVSHSSSPDCGCQPAERSVGQHDVPSADMSDSTPANMTGSYSPSADISDSDLSRTAEPEQHDSCDHLHSLTNWGDALDEDNADYATPKMQMSTFALSTHACIHDRSDAHCHTSHGHNTDNDKVPDNSIAAEADAKAAVPYEDGVRADGHEEMVIVDGAEVAALALATLFQPAVPDYDEERNLRLLAEAKALADEVFAQARQHEMANRQLQHDEAAHAERSRLDERYDDLSTVGGSKSDNAPYGQPQQDEAAITEPAHARPDDSVTEPGSVRFSNYDEDADLKIININSNEELIYLIHKMRMACPSSFMIDFPDLAVNVDLTLGKALNHLYGAVKTNTLHASEKSIDSVISKAVQKNSKPGMVLEIVKAMQQRGPGSVPLLFRSMFDTVGRLSANHHDSLQIPCPSPS